MLFALLRNIKINPIKSAITTPSERFIGTINPLVNVPFVIFEKLTIIKENIETKIIRLITRIMFVWFIKQKGLVPELLFDINKLKPILKDFNPYDEQVGNMAL